MELKHNNKCLPHSDFGCINRTFMELKLLPVMLEAGGAQVLIEPLWNWNYNAQSFTLSVSGINRTFMELKLKHKERNSYIQ